MAPIELHFVNEPSLIKRGQRDRYLIQSEAKSHAARRSSKLLRYAEVEKPARRELSKRNSGKGDATKTDARSSYDSGFNPHENYAAPIVAQIFSILDPFLRLARDVSSRDEELLSFYLTTGRGLLFGTTDKPGYCPCLDVISRGIMQRSSAFLHSHVAMSEFLWHSLRSSDVSANFFHHREKAYKSVRDVMDDPHATFDDKLCGMICLQSTEHATQNNELKLIHLKAMHDLVERNGGILSPTLYKASSATLTEPMFYVSQFVFSDYRIPLAAGETPELRRQRFNCSLQRILCWTRSTDDTWQGPNDHIVLNEVNFTTLNLYLRWMIDARLGILQAPYHETAGAFLFLFTLCSTISRLNLSLQSSLRFLHMLQKRLENSSPSHVDNVRNNPACKIQSVLRLHPHVATLLVSQCMKEYVRRGDYTEYVADQLDKRSDGKGGHMNGPERLVCAEAIDALQIFMGLWPEKRMQLGLWLFDNISTVLRQDMSSAQVKQPSTICDLWNSAIDDQSPE